MSYRCPYCFWTGDEPEYFFPGIGSDEPTCPCCSATVRKLNGAPPAATGEQRLDPEEATAAVLARLREARDRLREHYGASYDSMIEPIRALLRPHRSHALSYAVRAARNAAAKGQEGSAWALLAAAADVVGLKGGG